VGVWAGVDWGGGDRTSRRCPGGGRPHSVACQGSAGNRWRESCVLVRAVTGGAEDCHTRRDMATETQSAASVLRCVVHCVSTAYILNVCIY